MSISKDTTEFKVLLAGHLPPPIGGVASYYQALLSSSLPHRVNLLFVDTSTHNRETSDSGRFTLSNLFAAQKDWVRFFRAVLFHRPHVSHIGTAHGLSFCKHSLCVVIARLFGSQVLLHHHCGFPVLYSEHSGWWRWFFRRVIHLTNGVIALSSEWKEISQLVPGIQVFFLQNGIDLAPYQNIVRERFLRCQVNRAVHVLYLGNIGQAKGSFELIDTAQRLAYDGVEIYFDLVGNEIRTGELDVLRQHLEDTCLTNVIKIHPPVIGVEKFAYFLDTDIFVYPSYSEGMPIAVIEAMASGLPIVATNVGGLPDLVIDGLNGILVDPGRPDQLAAALLTIASDPKLRRSMGEESARLAKEHFDIEHHVNQLVSIYDKVISDRAMNQY
jgi:glycosyltransferase involved in cell wall biosynthesis